MPGEHRGVLSNNYTNQPQQYCYPADSKQNWKNVGNNLNAGRATIGYSAFNTERARTTSYRAWF